MIIILFNITSYGAKQQPGFIFYTIRTLHISTSLSNHGLPYVGTFGNKRNSIGCESAVDHNKPVAQIPRLISPVSHNAPFCNRNMHMCTYFRSKMVNCGIFALFIVRFGICLKATTICVCKCKYMVYCQHLCTSNGFVNKTTFVI